jgi:hypothetical protein
MADIAMDVNACTGVKRTCLAELDDSMVESRACPKRMRDSIVREIKEPPASRFAPCPCCGGWGKVFVIHDVQKDCPLCNTKGWFIVS